MRARLSRLGAFLVYGDVDPPGITPEHRPMRGDDVAVWLRGQREEYPRGSRAWLALDEALDCYREHADTGTPLLVRVAHTEHR